MTAAELVRMLQADGARPETIAAVLDTLAEASGAAVKLRQAATLRKRRQRQRARAMWEDDAPLSRDSHGTETSPRVPASRDDHATAQGHATSPSPPKKVSPVPPSKNHPPAPTTPKAPEGELFESDKVEARNDDYPRDGFMRWWTAYPHKVGKITAEASFKRVRKGRKATFAQLMEGLDAYVRTKPVDRPWANPATWLNQGRWGDQPAEAVGHGAHDPGREARVLESLRRTIDGRS